MTIIASVTDGSTVTMGADSGCGNLETQEMYSLDNPRKIIKKGSYLIGFAGSFRLGQALMFSDLPEPDGNLMEHLVKNFVPAVAQILRDDRSRFGEISPGRTDIALGPKGNLIFGVWGRLFCLTADMSLLEGSSLAIGNARAYAFGALHVLENLEMTPDEMVRHALEAAAEFGPGVKGPFHYESVTTTPGSLEQRGPRRLAGERRAG